MSLLAKEICTMLGHKDAEIASLKAQIELLSAELAQWHKLNDPENLHVNLLQGKPAQLSREKFLHLAGDGAMEKLELLADLQAPSRKDAYAMGAKGSKASEGERLAFEAWMRGRRLRIAAEWDGTDYRSEGECEYERDLLAECMRRMWAAWRDRAALAPGVLQRLRGEE